MSDNLWNNWKDAIFEEKSCATLNEHLDSVVSLSCSSSSESQILEELRKKRPHSAIRLEPSKLGNIPSLPSPMIIIQSDRNVMKNETIQQPTIALQW